MLPAFVNDPAGWLRFVKPFLLDSQSQFRSAGPFPLTSAEYATEFNEVKSIGSLTSTTRTMFQTNSDLYWAENGARTWNRVFRNLSAQTGLTLEENARLFAMLNTSVADALINVWDDKAFYGFWRPITAIREAHLDGNAGDDGGPELVAADRDPAVSGPLVGGLGGRGAAARTMQNVFGPNVSPGRTPTSAVRRGASPAPRTRNDEVVDPLWSGIHFRRADVHGADRHAGSRLVTAHTCKVEAQARPRARGTSRPRRMRSPGGYSVDALTPRRFRPCPTGRSRARAVRVDEPTG